MTASERRSADEPPPASSVSFLRIVAFKPRLEQNEEYMCRSSAAKIPASSPPAPGRISRRHGSCAKGCFGIKACLRSPSNVDREDLVASRSSNASERSSESVEESFSIECSSVIDFWIQIFG